jgi:hypothetical protein
VLAMWGCTVVFHRKRSRGDEAVESERFEVSMLRAWLVVNIDFGRG